MNDEYIDILIRDRSIAKQAGFPKRNNMTLKATERDFGDEDDTGQMTEDES